MTYNDFLNLLLNGVNLFFDNIGIIVNYLLTNYIFITILGLVIILSIVKYLFSLIFNPFENVIEDLDNPNGPSLSSLRAIEDITNKHNEKMKREKARRRYGFHSGGK